MAKIAIVIPVYNVERYLARCLDSVIAQTMSDLDIVVVDDGSTDLSGIICDEYAKRDPRIVVIHQNNGGLSVARNAGLSWISDNSNCEWIGFVDSDDWIHPQMYELLYKSGGGYIKVCRYKFANVEISDYKKYEKYNCYTDNGLTIFYRIGAESTGIAAWNKLYKKELFERERFPVGKIYEDSYLVYKLMDSAKTVTFVDLPLYYYYQRDDGIMGEAKKGFKESDLDRIRAREEQYRYVRNKHRKDLYIESARMLLKAYSWC